MPGIFSSANRSLIRFLWWAGVREAKRCLLWEKFDEGLRTLSHPLPLGPMLEAERL